MTELHFQGFMSGRNEAEINTDYINSRRWGSFLVGLGFGLPGLIVEVICTRSKEPTSSFLQMLADSKSPRFAWGYREGYRFFSQVVRRKTTWLWGLIGAGIGLLFAALAVLL